MKQILIALLAVVAFASVATAGMKSGSRYTDLDGGTVTFNFTLHPMHNATSCTVTDGQGTSEAAAGTPTGNGCGSDTDDSGNMTTDDGGTPPGNHETFRVKGGKAQQKNDSGQWKNLKAASGLQPTDAPGDECDSAVTGGGGPAPLPLPGGSTVGSHPNQ